MFTRATVGGMVGGVMILVTAAEMRRLDERTIELGTPGYTLMERAGAGATEALLQRFPAVSDGRVVIVAGKGNNGGDGSVVARLLRAQRVAAEVVLLAPQEELTGDAARALGALRKGGGRFVETVGPSALVQFAKEIDGATLIVDAIFGTGLNTEITDWRADVVRIMNDSGIPIFAIDIPSGLDADRGVPLGVAVRAQATATFGFPKLGQVIHPGVEYVGELSVVDIGIDPQAVEEVAPRASLLTAVDAAAVAPWRLAQAHKGTCGHALVIAGSRGHSGAAILAAHAAARVGAGLATLAGPAALNDIFCSGPPEVMTAPLSDADGRLRFVESELRAVLAAKTAIAVGPGIGTHADAAAVVRFLLREAEAPLVLDADALTCIAADLDVLGTAKARVVLTPHPGEMARLLGCSVEAVQFDRIGAACAFADEHNCIVVLKGARTVVATPGGDMAINSTGNPGMASGGMGDVLCGMIAGLLAQRLDAEKAAGLAVYLHGEIADYLAEIRGPIGFLASDVSAGIPEAYRRLAVNRLRS